jgi:hypothetical protein
MGKQVILRLEKAGEAVELSFKFEKNRQRLHAVKELGKYWKKGWHLASLSGDSDYVAAMNRLLANYKTGDPVPVKGLMKETGLMVLPGFLRKRVAQEGSDGKEEDARQKTRQTET